MPAIKDDFDIDRARSDTRGCEDVVHFNNAGSSLMPAPVADALREYLNQEEMTGGYETAERNAEQLDNFYTATASLLNCNTGEVAFIENATRAWDMAFYSFRFNPGDKILTTIAEYGSNVIAYNQCVKRHGVELKFIENDAHGQIDVRALENQIDDKVKLVSMTHIPTGGGLINPAAAIGRVANAAGIPFLLDSCQGVGQVALDVKKIGCDMLCGTGRKYLRGPRATGFLYVREELIEQLEPPMLDQHAADLVSPTEYVIRKDAKRFENWEQNFAGKAALGVATDYALSFGMPAIQRRVCALASRLREQISALERVSITDEGLARGGIVTFTVDGKSPAQIKSGLSGHGINVSVSDGSGSLVSFVQRDLTEVVRASVHYFNTDAEVAWFKDSLEKVIAS
jgi:selenocysteine lyase/cysteine desulfurase